VESFFENLLPEGASRDLLSKANKSSSTFALLLAVAGDTAGSLAILPAGKTPETASYTRVDWNYIAEHFEGGVQNQGITTPLGSRISLSGAQAKMLISLTGDNQPMLPDGAAPSTWIVKPNIRGFDRVWSSAVNEAIIMRAAAHCGLSVAEVFFEPRTQACMIKRFDRLIGPKGAVTRLKQYDFCQLSGVVSGKKYEAEGGPGLAACAELIKNHSASPGADLMRFLQWIVYNLLTGNNDSHAKNLSMLHLPGQGVRLSPFYDLMDTRLYAGLSTRFAFKIGGQDEPGKITHAHLVAMSGELMVKPALVLGVVRSMHAKLKPALQAAISEIEPQLNHSGKALANKLQQHVTSIASKTATRLADADYLAQSAVDGTLNTGEMVCEMCDATPCVCDVYVADEPRHGG
jgi:serine/threonine-protein kinase HipA